VQDAFQAVAAHFADSDADMAKKARELEALTG
jgi:hypothetical protein